MLTTDLHSVSDISPRSNKTQLKLLPIICYATTPCLKKNRTPATFYNNSNSPGSIAIDFDKNNR